MAEMKKFRIRRLQHEVDGVDYISRYVTGLKKVGITYKACCPFHREKTPSFTIYPKGYLTRQGPQDHDSFYCFGCDAGGDIIKFQELLHGVTREQAVYELEKEFGYSEDDTEEVEFIKSEIKLSNNKLTKMLSFAEVNLNISICCRKYLEYIKKHYPDQYTYEVKLIDKYYKYIDLTLPDCNDLEANLLYYKIDNKLKQRKNKYKGRFLR